MEHYTIIKTPTEHEYNKAIKLLFSEGISSPHITWRRSRERTVLYYDKNNWLGMDDGRHFENEPDSCTLRSLIPPVPDELFEL